MAGSNVEVAKVDDVIGGREVLGTNATRKT